MCLLGPIWAFSTSCGRCPVGACSSVAARSFPHSPIVISVRRAWAALASGRWSLAQLPVAHWQCPQTQRLTGHRQCPSRAVRRHVAPVPRIRQSTSSHYGVCRGKAPAVMGGPSACDSPCRRSLSPCCPQTRRCPWSLGRHSALPTSGPAMTCGWITAGRPFRRYHRPMLPGRKRC